MANWRRSQQFVTSIYVITIFWLSSRICSTLVFLLFVVGNLKFSFPHSIWQFFINWRYLCEISLILGSHFIDFNPDEVISTASVSVFRLQCVAIQLCWERSKHHQRFGQNTVECTPICLIQLNKREQCFYALQYTIDNYVGTLETIVSILQLQNITCITSLIQLHWVSARWLVNNKFNSNYLQLLPWYPT